MAKRSLVKFQMDEGLLRRVQRKLAGDTLYRDDVRRILTETVIEVEGKARSRVPVGETGALASSIRHRVHAAPRPLWAKVVADAERSGFRYGWALQGSQSIPYRHRSGPRSGKLTRFWFTGALRGIRKKLNERLRQAGQRIEDKWRR